MNNEKRTPVIKKRKNRIAKENKAELAIGEIMQTEGPAGLKMSNISKYSGVDKKMLYRDYGTVENLVEAFWESEDIRFQELPVDVATLTKDKLVDLVMAAVQKHYLFFTQNKAARSFMIWEITERNKFLSKMNKKSEAVHQVFLDQIKPFLKEKEAKFITVYATIYSSVNSFVLRTKNIPGSHYGFNAGNEERRKQLFLTFREMLEFSLR